MITSLQVNVCRSILSIHCWMLQKVKFFIFFCCRYSIEVENLEHKASIIRNIQWPSVSEFTIQVGEEKLREYIDFASDVREQWNYRIRFLEKRRDFVSDFYIYESLFSIPTQVYPVAQATVSIIFTIEVSRIIPKFCKVVVTFELEDSDMKMIPGVHNITDSMLSRTVSKKIGVFKRMLW